MKLAVVLLASLSCAASVSAQYFSSGWQPGQPVPSEAPQPPPLFEHGASPPQAQAQAPAKQPAPEGERISVIDLVTDPVKVLNSGPVNALASKFGVNMTEKIEQAKKQADIWDHRIPLITDNNFDELIVNEPLSPEEEEERVWFMIITVSGSGTNAFSRSADKHFDEAFNKTMIENDLPNVRFGRIDYLNVTYITTKWGIWSAPYIVLLRERGQDLRFYKANTVRLDADTIRAFLKEEGWRESEPWRSSFGPGGSNEYLMHYFATAMKKMYELMVRVPKVVLMLVSGVVANYVMKWIHRNDAPEAKEKPEAPPAEEDAGKANPLTGPAPENGSSTATTPTKGKTTKRKSGKK